jgi:hypothetical protein
MFATQRRVWRFLIGLIAISGIRSGVTTLSAMLRRRGKGSGPADGAAPRKRVSRRWGRRLAMGLQIVVQIYIWLAFFTTNARHPSIGNSYEDFGLVVILVISLIWLILQDAASRAWLAFVVVGMLSSLLITFAQVYYNYGGDGAFTQRLTHLDAVYIAVGIFTTAGTGTLAPLSQQMRLAQTIQMLVGFVFVAIAIGMALQRFMTPGREDRSRGTVESDSGAHARGSSGG